MIFKQDHIHNSILQKFVKIKSALALITTQNWNLKEFFLTSAGNLFCYCVLSGNFLFFYIQKADKIRFSIT